MKPIELALDGLIGRNLNRRNPVCQNLDELRAAIEWHRFPQANLRRRFISMRRNVRELYWKRGGYTPY